VNLSDFIAFHILVRQRCKCLFKGACPVWSWKRREECCRGSFSINFEKCFKGAVASISWRRLYRGESFIIFDNSSLMICLNCCFSADLLIGSVVSAPVLAMRSDFGSLL
jgi:hypothetical protein